MARNEVEEVEETSETTDKKYFTATLSKEGDADLIKSVDRLKRIGGFSVGEILKLGVEEARKSDQYQDALKSIKDEMGL